MDNDDTLAFGEEHQPKGKLKHPFVTVCHVIFRILSIVIYIICGFTTNGFIGSFVSIVLLLSIDFWVVKNITGRLMVGLRWWNYIDEEGLSHWVFEARKDLILDQNIWILGQNRMMYRIRLANQGDRQGRVSSVEAQIFWGALVVTPAVWSVLFLIAIARWNFKWIMIVCIALTLSGSNLYGYVRCKIGKSEGIAGSFKKFASNIAQKQMVSNMTSYFSRAPPTTSPSTTI